MMSKNKGLKEAILKISDGLIGSLTDFLLFQFFLSGELLGAITNRDIADAFEKARSSLDDFNYKKFKNVMSYLFKNDLISKKSLDQKKRGGKIELRITHEGKARIREIIPTYKKIRTWDGKIYLVTYDIPEEKKRKRDLLRDYLKKIGCGLLQESVWLTPYNPKIIVQDFIKENDLSGLILVSSLGKDSSIGDEDLKSLVKRVYKLDLLNKKYEEFIRRFKDKQLVDKMNISFAYFQILKDDPQLPFELLPDTWLGNKAYKLFTSLI